MLFNLAPNIVQYFGLTSLLYAKKKRLTLLQIQDRKNIVSCEPKYVLFCKYIVETFL